MTKKSKIREYYCSSCGRTISDYIGTLSYVRGEPHVRICCVFIELKKIIGNNILIYVSNDS